MLFYNYVSDVNRCINENIVYLEQHGKARVFTK